VLLLVTAYLFGQHLLSAKAERQSLENIATPLTAQDSDSVRGGAAPAAT
jgi:hypothetical protein